MRVAFQRLRKRFSLLGDEPWVRAQNAESALEGVYASLTASTVLTGLLLWSGAGAFEVGLLSSLTTGGGLLVFLAGRLRRRFASHKRLTLVMWAAAWASWLPVVVALGWLALGGRATGVIAPFVLITTFVSAALNSIGIVSWNEWLARLVPRQERGVFLADRARWLNLAGLVILPAIGYALDESKALHSEQAVFAVIFLVAACGALFRHQLLAVVPAFRQEALEPSVSARHARVPALEPRRFSLYTIIYQVGIYFGAPFFQLWSMQRLGLSFAVLMNLQVLAQVLPVLTLGRWGRLIDRIGLRVPLAWCSIGKALVPLCYLVATPDCWWPIIPAYALSVLDAGLTVANNSAYAQLAEGHGGATRVAHISLVTSIAASVTPLLAGLVVSSLNSGSFDALVAMFVLSAILRAVSGAVVLAPSTGPRARARAASAS